MQSLYEPCITRLQVIASLVNVYLRPNLSRNFNDASSSADVRIPVFAGRRSSLYFLSFRSYGILWLGAVNYAASVASEILT